MRSRHACCCRLETNANPSDKRGSTVDCIALLSFLHNKTDSLVFSCSGTSVCLNKEGGGVYLCVWYGWGWVRRLGERMYSAKHLKQGSFLHIAWMWGKVSIKNNGRSRDQRLST